MLVRNRGFVLKSDEVLLPEEKRHRIRLLLLEVIPSQWTTKTAVFKMKYQFSSYTNKDTANKVLDALIAEGEVEVKRDVCSPSKPRSRKVDFIRRRKTPNG